MSTSLHTLGGLALLALLSLPARAQEPGPEAALEQAYQKEYAYLVAEKWALEARLLEQQAETDRRLREAEARVEETGSKLLGIERQADAIEGRIERSGEAITAAEEARDLLDTTLVQGGEGLGLTLADTLPEAEKLDQIFQAAASRMEQGGQVRTSPGEFFLPDGTRVEGQRIHLGEVGAYGLAEQGAGSLLPVGNARLQLRLAGGGEAEARALLAGEPPPVAGVFLFEGVDKPIVERGEPGVIEYTNMGGLVAWIIAGLGVFGLVLGLWRLLSLTLASRGRVEAEQAAALVQQGELGRARQFLQADRPVLRVLGAVLAAPARSREALHDIAGEALLRELPAIERGNAIILVVAAVAPLLGLLGTVTGMISTFDVITELGTGDPRMLSGGISEALITTEYGLMVAIPAVLLGNLVRGRAEAVTGGIEQLALHLVNLLQDEVPDEEDSSSFDDEQWPGPRVVHG